MKLYAYLLGLLPTITERFGLLRLHLEHNTEQTT